MSVSVAVLLCNEISGGFVLFKNYNVMFGYSIKENLGKYCAKISCCPIEIRNSSACTG